MLDMLILDFFASARVKISGSGFRGFRVFGQKGRSKMRVWRE